MTNPLENDDEYQAYLDELANDDPKIFADETIQDLMPDPADLEREIARALDELDCQQVRLSMSEADRRAAAAEIATQRVLKAGVKGIRTELLKAEERKATRAKRAKTSPEKQLKQGKRIFCPPEKKQEWATRAVYEWRKNTRQSARQLALAIVNGDKYKPQMFEQIYEVVLDAINVEKTRP